jgi:hypothetical protein
LKVAKSRKNELASREKRFDHTLQEDFMKIPGSPIAYWLSSPARYIFETSPAITSVATSAVGLQTGDNDRFLKYWFEVQNDKIYLNALIERAR